MTLELSTFSVTAVFSLFFYFRKCLKPQSRPSLEETLAILGYSVSLSASAKIVHFVFWPLQPGISSLIIQDLTLGVAQLCGAVTVGWFGIAGIIRTINPPPDP